jgi:hypothetical protein
MPKQAKKETKHRVDTLNMLRQSDIAPVSSFVAVFEELRLRAKPFNAEP